MSILANSLFFGAPSAGVIKPSITFPLQGSVGVTLPITFNSSAYTYVGTATTHASSDWRLFNSTNTNSSPVASVTNSAADKTTWTVSNLSLSTNYWAQVRYRAATGEISEWSDLLGFTTTPFLTPFVNGTLTVSTEQAWTVPAQIGQLRVRFYTGYAYDGSFRSGYGTSEYELGVVPGETLRLSAEMLGIPDQGGPVRTQACCFIAQGQWGGVGGEAGLDTVSAWARGTAGNCGGRPGDPNGGNAPSSGGSTGGYGGTTSAAGLRALPNQTEYYNDPNNYYAPDGGPLGRRASDPYVYGAGTGKTQTFGSVDRFNGGGGFGWFSGGSGCLYQDGQAGGGGGSSYNNIPSSRNPIVNQSPIFSGGVPPGAPTSGKGSSGPRCIITW